MEGQSAGTSLANTTTFGTLCGCTPARSDRRKCAKPSRFPGGLLAVDASSVSACSRSAPPRARKTTCPPRTSNADGGSRGLPKSAGTRPIGPPQSSSSTAFSLSGIDLPFHSISCSRSKVVATRPKMFMMRCSSAISASIFTCSASRSARRCASRCRSMSMVAISPLPPCMTAASTPVPVPPPARACASHGWRRALDSRLVLARVDAAPAMSRRTRSCFSAVSSHCSLTKPWLPSTARGSGTTLGKPRFVMPFAALTAAVGMAVLTDHLSVVPGGCWTTSSLQGATKMPFVRRSSDAPTYSERPGKSFVIVRSPGNKASSTTPMRKARPSLRSLTSTAIAPKGAPRYAWERSTS
mmetsp:Transcript_82088/g.238013  ORF Transcript_82088/g.238013 Transcript_82088/m.238013 type:complete len:354 (+) Transcript_82088:1034-2095(+)